MTIETIKAEVKRIEGLSWDSEVAHGREDDLHQAVLANIADGTLEGCTPAEAAREALKSTNISFARWCA
jgi:hypothetical protein